MNEKKKWLVSDVRMAHPDEVKRLSDGLSVSAITASVLYNRKLFTVDEAMRFIRKETVLLHDPYIMKDMDKAVLRITEALRKKEKIVIYGDYDVDGVTSVSTLYLYLQSKGADVDYYIPNRNGEGYGINLAALDTLAKNGTKLMITVDTGITALSETDYANSLGIDIIVTDHHECHPTLPNAVAVVNPKRSDCNYPFKELAGVGVVFKLICAIECKFWKDAGNSGHGYINSICKDYIDLVAIGTISDVMPLMDENRLIVSMGLHIMDDTKRPGLAVLLDMVGSKDDRIKKKKKLTSSYIGFVVAPKINAAGRLSSASIAVELFLTKDTAHAKSIVEKLIEINTERQATESAILEEAYKKISEEHDFDNDTVIVLDGDNWHQGVIGIVASRITEYYNLPAILVSFEDGIGKGSGRSIRGINLVDALRDSEDLLIKFGGHALAAGLSIERAKLDDFKKRINKYAKEHVSAEGTEVNLDIDCEVFPSEFNISLAEELLCLEPYGISNPVPVFVMRGVKVVDICGIGQNKHTRLTLSSPEGIKMTALCFGTAPESIESISGELIDVVFNVNINEFQNQKTVQMIVKDMAFSQDNSLAKQRHEKIIAKIKSGAFLTQRECLSYIPGREDYVLFYRYLRKEISQGRDIFSERYLASQHIGHPEKFNMTKIRVIIKVFEEAGIITAESVPTQYSLGNKYRLQLTESDKKLSLDSSELYRYTKKYKL